MSKANRGSGRRRQRTATGGKTEEGRLRSAEKMLNGPLGRALADEFYSTYRGFKEQYAGREELLYESFTQLVLAGYIKMTSIGDRVLIELDPKIAAAIRAGGSPPWGGPATGGSIG